MFHLSNVIVTCKMLTVDYVYKLLSVCDSSI